MSVTWSCRFVSRKKSNSSKDNSSKTSPVAVPPPVPALSPSPTKPPHLAIPLINIAGSSAAAGQFNDNFIGSDRIVETRLPTGQRFAYHMDRVRLLIREVAANELPNVNWNGKNDVFVRMSVGSWIMDTPVQWGTGKKAVWEAIDLEHILELQEERVPIEELEMKVEVYNKNLSRTDQIIGIGKVSLSLIEINIPVDPITSQRLKEEEETERLEKEKAAKATWFKDGETVEPMPKAPAQDVVIDLFTPPGLQKPRYRGHVALRVFAEYLTDGEPEVISAPPSDNKLTTIQNTAANAAILPAVLDKFAESVETTPTHARRKESKTNFSLDFVHSNKIMDPNSSQSSTSSPREVSRAHGVSPLMMMHDENSRSSTPTSENGNMGGFGSGAGTARKTLSGKASTGHSQAIKGSARSVGSVHSVSETGGAPVLKPAIASSSTMSASTASRLQASGTPPLADTYRVIDEAFAAGVRCECSMLTMKFEEVVQIVDALGYTIDPKLNIQHQERYFSGIAFDSGNHSGQLAPLNGEPTIQLPMLSAAPLAAVLTKFIADNKLCRLALSATFAVSEQNAEICVKNLRSLVEGNWLKARFLILLACNRTDIGSGRPDLWITKWVVRLLKILQLPVGPVQSSSGHDFLELSKEQVAEQFAAVPSILQYRLFVYQHTLRLLEQWWDRGFRPNDHYVSTTGIKAGVNFAVTAPSTTAAAATGKIAASKTALSTTEGGVRGRWSPLDAVPKAKLSGKNLTATTTISSAPGPKWGQLEEDIYDDRAMISADGKTSLMLLKSPADTSKKIFIEIADFHSLLEAWVPLNRAYSWGLSIEVLSSLAAKLSGAIGYLTATATDHDRGAYSRSIPLQPETNPNANSNVRNVRECRWVAFAHSDASSSPENNYTDIISLLSYERKHNPIIQDAATGEDAILIPLKCLRTSHSGADTVGASGLFGRTDSNSSFHSRGSSCLANMPTSAIVPGMTCKIANDLYLSRACERFSWWDRPPQEILLKMAEQKCVIVSIADVKSKGRAGVRVLNASASDSEAEIVDALPLEALYVWDENDDLLAQQAKAAKLAKKKSSIVSVKTAPPAQDDDEVVAAKRRASKRKKSRSKRKSLQDDIAVAVATTATDPNDVINRFISSEAAKSSGLPVPVTAVDNASNSSSSPVSVHAPGPTSANNPKYATKIREAVAAGTTRQSKSAGHSAAFQDSDSDDGEAELKVAKDTGAPVPFVGRPFFRPNSSALKQAGKGKAAERPVSPPTSSAEPTSPYAWMKGMVDQATRDKAVVRPRVVVEKAGTSPGTDPVDEVDEDNMIEHEPVTESLIDKLLSPHLNVMTPMLDIDHSPEHNNTKGPAGHHIRAIKLKKHPQPWRPTSTQTDNFLFPRVDEDQQHREEEKNLGEDDGPSFQVTGQMVGGKTGAGNNEEAKLNADEAEGKKSANPRPSTVENKKQKKKIVTKAWVDEVDAITPMQGAAEPYGIMFDPPVLIDNPASDNPNKSKKRPTSAAATIRNQQEYQETVQADAVLNFGLNFEPPALPDAKVNKKEQTMSKKKDHKDTTKQPNSDMKDKENNKNAGADGEPKFGLQFDPPIATSTYTTTIVPPTRPKSATIVKKQQPQQQMGPQAAEEQPEKESNFTVEQQRMLRRETQRTNKELNALEGKLNSGLKAVGVKDKVLV
jgi:hypothetical protein